MSSRLSEHMPSTERLRELLVGKKVVSAIIHPDERPEDYSAGPTGHLVLSDGTELKVWGNDGGCACDAGCYPLTELNTCDNTITNVEVEAKPDSEDIPCPTCGSAWCYDESHEKPDVGHYRIFVFAEDRRIQIASFDGTDGNGYYGTGYWIEVSPSEDGHRD